MTEFSSIVVLAKVKNPMSYLESNRGKNLSMIVDQAITTLRGSFMGGPALYDSLANPYSIHGVGSPEVGTDKAADLLVQHTPANDNGNGWLPRHLVFSQQFNSLFHTFIGNRQQSRKSDNIRWIVLDMLKKFLRRDIHPKVFNGEPITPESNVYNAFANVVDVSLNRA
jgi:hypothetical protein